MITDAFLGVLAALVEGLFSMFPPFNLDSFQSFVDGVVGMAHNVGTWVATANGYVPIDALAIAISIYWMVRSAMFIWRMLVWAYERIPFKFS